MNEQTVSIPRHLVMLGEEARRLVDMLDQGLSRKVAASRSIWGLRGYLINRLDRLASLIDSTASQGNQIGNLGMMRGTWLTQWRMKYALWRLRNTLRVMLCERHKLYRVRATENQQKIFVMLAEYCDLVLREVQGMLMEVAQTLADPLAAMRRKGLQPIGNRLELVVEMTFPVPDFDELMRRIRLEFPQEITQQMLPARRKPASTLNILITGLLLGWVFGEIFENHDKKDC